jgi:predicted DNA-binding protein (MmcQ/YjbR family)
MSKDINDAVREVCLWFPEAEEVPSRGSPDFRVRGKTFATYVINHHGDGIVALWLRSPPGAQQMHSENDPKNYYVPPYVGPRGWLGVRLDRHLSWDTIATRVREAYEEVAPARLSAEIGETISIIPPNRMLTPEEIDPMNAPRARDMLVQMRDICLRLPETSETSQFGNPVWKAGKKTFAGLHHYRGERLSATFWVGPERQAMLTFDDASRYYIPAYMGHNGWIALEVQDESNIEELKDLALLSYRHFALKRMLKELDGLDM